MICLLVPLGTLMNRHAPPIEVKVIAVISTRHEHHFVPWWETTSFYHCCQLHFLHVEPHLSLLYPCWTHLAQCPEYGSLTMTVDYTSAHFISVFLLWNGPKLFECQKCRCCNKHSWLQNNCKQGHTLGFALNLYIITNLSCGCRKHWQAKSILFTVFLIVLFGKVWMSRLFCQVIVLLFFRKYLMNMMLTSCRNKMMF